MVEELVKRGLEDYKNDISKIDENIKIDCVTIFSISDENYNKLNNELKTDRLIDEMSSGNLYYLNNPIYTNYGKLYFVKVRKHDEIYNNYKISADFVVDNYEEFKSKLTNPIIKKYDTFELIQFKNDLSIINIVSLSAFDDYKI